MNKILSNKIRCKICNDVVESMSRHDFKWCSCGAVAVDGGRDYLRRGGNREDWEELSEYENKIEQQDLMEEIWKNKRAPVHKLSDMLQDM